MKLKTITKTAIGGLLFLSSNYSFSAATDLTVKSINVPTYNIISDALSNMNAVNGKPNDFIMKQICDLARGDKTQQDVNSLLKSKNIDASAIPAQGSLSSLMVNGNQPVQAYACATYLVATLFQPMDNSILYQEKKSKKGKNETVLDAEKFASEIRLKVSLAQATAQLYAVIANNLPTDTHSSWDDYQRSVVNTVYNYAPEYLNLLKGMYIADTANYTPVTISKQSLYVEDDQGRELQISASGVVLRKRGVIWLGNGKILGKKYLSPLTVIPAVKSRLQSESVKPETPEVTKENIN